MAVHAAVGNESEQMKPMATRLGEDFLQYPITRELALGDSLVNPGQVLMDDSASAQVEMADFRIAHLSFWQAHVAPAGAQFSPRILSIEAVVKWRVSKERGVAVFLTFIPAAGIDAPAIANDKHDWRRHMARTLPMIENIDKRFFR